MKHRDSLARQTLDTLPFNIAVLDADGTILFTNTAWREFAGVGSGEGDMVGRNYFAGVDGSQDDHAAAAVRGIRQVIAGEQDVFTLEYPCHVPDERQWFLMRAARLPDHEEGAVVVAHIDITQRKLAELQARDRQRELEQVTTRIEGLVGTVMETALQASSRTELEETLCRQLTALEPYVCAWVGHVDLSAETIRPAAGAGRDWPDCDRTLAMAAEDPTARALRTGESQVVRDPDEDALAASHWADTPADVGALAAFPLACGDTSYGILTVYADRTAAFDDRETTVLSVLARVVSTAINAMESRRLLTSDHIVELEIALSPEGPFFADISRALDCTLEYEGAIHHEDALTLLFVVRDADANAVVERAIAHDGVTAVTSVSENDDRAVVEFRVADSLVDLLAEWGAETTDIVADAGNVRLTVELSGGADVRTFVEQLADRYPSTDLLARHERERPDKTRQELLADIEAELTDRQRLALQKAWLGGFFEWPRNVSGEELAESMDITPSTYHQHLRGAEQKVISSLLEDDSAVE